MDDLKNIAESCRGSDGTIHLTPTQANVVGLKGEPTPGGGLLVACKALVEAVDAATKAEATKTTTDTAPEAPSVPDARKGKK